MVEECKTLEKGAKEVEKEDLAEAVKGYKAAADCYNRNDKPKNATSCLGKSAKQFVQQH